MYAAVISIYLIIASFELIPMFKTNKIKESVLYSIMMIASLTVSMLIIADVKIPSPADFIEKIVLTLVKNN